MTILLPTEAQFGDRLCAEAGWRGWLRFHPRPARTKNGVVTATQGDVGWPDWVLINRQVPDIIVRELKRERSDHPTAEQQVWLDRWQALGIDARVTCWEDSEEIFDRLASPQPGLWVPAGQSYWTPRANTASRRDVRGALEETAILPVLTTEVPLREAIAGAEGTTPANLDGYDEALEELTRLTQKAPR